VLFNLFSEAEPFAAILIAQGTLEGIPEAQRAKIRGREQGGVLGERAEPPSHQLESLGSAVSSPSRV